MSSNWFPRKFIVRSGEKREAGTEREEIEAVPSVTLLCLAAINHTESRRGISRHKWK